MGKESAPVEARAPAASPAAPAQSPQPSASAKSKPSDIYPGIPGPKPGWSKVVVDDEVPVCIFASLAEQAKAPFREYVTKQTFRAGSSITIGAYGPWCVNEQCDQLPTLQCSVDRKDQTLVVRTHYWSHHKDGANCTENCRMVFAGCESPPLEAGAYTVKHGRQIFKLRIPSELQDPCFGEFLTPK